MMIVERFIEESNPSKEISNDVAEKEDPAAMTREENVSTSASLQASSTSPKEAKVMFMGSITSKKYHRLNCRYALKIKPENRIYFQSLDDAKEQGCHPCKSCSSLELAYENAGQAWSLWWTGRIGPVDPLLRIAEIGERGHFSMQAL